MTEEEIVARVIVATLQEESSLFFASDYDPDPAEAVPLEGFTGLKAAKAAIAALDKHRAEKAGYRAGAAWADLVERQMAKRGKV